MTEKPTVKESDRKEAERIWLRIKPKGITANMSIEILAAELAAVREEGRSPGPCGNHPKAYWEATHPDNVRTFMGDGTETFMGTCTACEREKPLVEALRKLIAKLETMEGPINAAIVIATAHNFPYAGPNWTVEVDAGREALKAWRKTPPNAL